ncbi:MAG: ankyrin repeat domain-containing protein [Candidatus Babeliales bacterium]
MNILKKELVLFIFLTLSTLTNSMQVEEPAESEITLEEIPTEILDHIIMQVADDTNINTIITSLSALSHIKLFYDLLSDSKTINKIIQKLSVKDDVNPLWFALLLFELPGTKKWLAFKNKTQYQPYFNKLALFLFSHHQALKEQYFLESGTDKSILTFEETPSLHLQVADTLLTLGIDPNLADSQGTTLLMKAIQTCQKNLVYLLLATPRIDINAQNLYGRTALDIAKNKNKPEIIEILQKNVGK